MFLTERRLSRTVPPWPGFLTCAPLGTTTFEAVEALEVVSALGSEGERIDGTPTRSASPRPGDFLFFGTDWNGPQAKVVKGWGLTRELGIKRDVREFGGNRHNGLGASAAAALAFGKTGTTGESGLAARNKW